MSARKSKLDQLNVAKPCSADWDRMTGNNQKRFCSECNKHVFDFSLMTRQQIEAVTAAHQGNLCARIIRREDGSMVTAEPLPLYASRRLNSPMLNAAVATVLGLGIPATAQPVTIQQGQAAVQSKNKQKDNDKKTEAGAVSSISGTVTDVVGAVVVGAVIKLLAPSSPPLITNSSAEGAFQFTGVTPGTYTLMVESSGFKTVILTDVRALAGTDTPISVALEPNAQTATVGMMISEPATLLKLHQDSELIAIVTIGKSKVIKTEDDSNQLQTTLQISSVLKGDTNQRAVPFYHWISEENKDELKPGDRLLVFLDQRKSEDGKPIDGFETHDWSRSVRKLDDDALTVFRQRIEDLNSILATETPDQAALIEWIVRCIEEPATRWDGAYELDKSLYAMKVLREKSRGSDKAAQLHQSVAAEASKEADAEEQEEDSAKLAALLLSNEQKARVANALFRIAELSADDMLLVNLVQDWENQRLATYLTAQLQKLAAEAPPLAEEIVSALADLFDDDAVQKAATAYKDGIEYDASEYDSDEESANKAPKPKTVAAQIAISKRSTKLVAFLAAVNQKLNR